MKNSTDNDINTARIAELKDTLFSNALATRVVDHLEDGADRLDWACRFVTAVTTGRISPITTDVTPRGELVYVGMHEARGSFRHLASMVKVVDSLPDTYRYGETINLFKAARQRTPDLDRFLDAEELWSWNLQPKQSPAFDALVETFNGIVTEIASLYQEGGFKRKIDQQRCKLDTQHDRCRTMVDEVFATCHRVLVLRIDFGYLKAFFDQVDLQRLSDDLEHLRNNMRHCPLFVGRITDFFKLEYGVSRGPHCHAVFFFNGSVRDPRKIVHLARMIGEYWVDVITGGMGAYFNCNDKVEEYDRRGQRGIGVIHHHETDLIENLKNRVFGYLVKSEQIAQLVVKPKFKRFRPGKVPVCRAGRPRTLVAQVIEASERMQPVD